eukprot:gnl/TRDRNA2_/TRDRNA2_125750_c2_seq1.p1 gnl/TRDRNA2_/TRDRNA2_125750_c2~~gnl/TRDRNA2_/TRDRNA2_125750_c2_seq1.p1  ORF type:complete len:497 (+),score=105.27 gnl/TRDRNA2_/TRDRNA2_125750_c2_seq1:2-1492(+)
MQHFLIEAECQDKLDFDSIRRFVNCCKDSEGFCPAQLDELQTVYKKYDTDGNGELDTLEVLDLITYQGHPTSVEAANGLIQKVDFNENGSMDIREFLRLMRLQREADAEKARDVFYAHADLNPISGGIPAQELAKCLAKLNQQEASQSVIDEVLIKQGSPKMLDLETFVDISDACRICIASKRRLRAGFTEEEFDATKKMYVQHCHGDPHLGLERGEVIFLLMTLKVPTNKIEDRTKIFDSLQKARKTAQDAGVKEEELGDPDSGRTTLFVLLFLLRELATETDKSTVQREWKAAEEAGFTLYEAAEYREVFSQWTTWVSEAEKKQRQAQATVEKWQQATKQSQGRRRSMPNITDVISLPEKLQSSGPLPAKSDKSATPSNIFTILAGEWQPRLSRDQLLNLLASLGLRFAAELRDQLEAKVSQLKAGNGIESSGLEFCDFLHLMRWMLDTDFAGINAVAEKAARTTEKKADEKCLARQPTMQREMSTNRPRRNSC